MQQTNWRNKLYFGDNLDILREHVTIDLRGRLVWPDFNS